MKIGSTPLVSIITVNYNSTDVTCEMLHSLKKSTFKNFEVIVVDNASKDDPSDRLKAAFPNVKVILAKQNLGFSGGNNLGIRNAVGDYLFLLNNDTELTPPLIELLVKSFNRDKSIGIVCPKIKFFFAKDIIQYAGFNKFNRITGRTTAVGSRQPDSDKYNISGFTHGAHGAAMLIKREVLSTVGLLPESFFLYYEEWDWSFKVIKAGYKIYFESSAEVFHKESVSTGKESTLKAYYQSRNRILLMKRNCTWLQYNLFIIFLITFVIPKKSYDYLTSRKFKNFTFFLKGTFDGTFNTSRKEPLPSL